MEKKIYHPNNIQNNLNTNNPQNNNINNNQKIETRQNEDSNNKKAIQNSENYSFSRYKKPIKTILKPLGDTSYLNAVLYSLGNIRNIASFFLNPKNQDYINQRIGKMPLSYVFQRLLIHLYPYPETDKIEIYEINTFLQVLVKLNIIYNTLQRRNPNELICFILNTLHKDLIQTNNNINMNLNLNVKDKNNVINNKIKFYLSSENSIILNNFNWFEIKESQCFQCGNTKYDLLTYNTFSLDIQYCYKMKKNNNGNNYITIYDCLQFYQTSKPQHFSCNNCKKNDIYITSKIFSSPNNFIFSLDRGIDFDQNDNLMKIPFHLYDKIDLNNFIENKNTPQQYEIIGIISIVIIDKKYVNFSRSPVDKVWYSYNDKNIEPIDINNIINKHNNYKELIPCILIYKAVEQ